MTANDHNAFYDATEGFSPDDVDPATHDAATCNLDVNACPVCAALERE